MQITWYGHAAFRLFGETKDVRIIMDPYRTPDVGAYAPIDDWADIVTTSHENQRSHSYVAGIAGRSSGLTPDVVSGVGLIEAEQPQVVHGVPFTAVRVWDDETRAVPVAMVGVTLDDVHVLHMGDCGHAPSAEEIAACKQVDVLLALTGGPPTLALTDVVAFIQDLKPRIVIPMHFGNEKINLSLEPVESFLNMLPPDIPVRHFHTSTVSVMGVALPTSTEVWVLPPAR